MMKDTVRQLESSSPARQDQSTGKLSTWTEHDDDDDDDHDVELDEQASSAEGTKVMPLA